MYVSAYLFVQLSTCIYLSTYIYLSIYLHVPTYMYLHLSIYLSIYLSMCLYLFASITLSINLFKIQSNLPIAATQGNRQVAAIHTVFNVVIIFSGEILSGRMRQVTANDRLPLRQV